MVIFSTLRGEGVLYVIYNLRNLNLDYVNFELKSSKGWRKSGRFFKKFV